MAKDRYDAFNLKAENKRIDIDTDKANADSMADLGRLLWDEVSGKVIPAKLPWPRISDRSSFLRKGTMVMLAGPPGVGKSFFCNQINMRLQDDEIAWKYLPLEDSKTDWARRVLARISMSYDIIKDDQEGAKWRYEQWEKHMGLVAAYSEHICDNPRKAYRNSEGGLTIPQFNQDDLIKWIDANRDQRVLVIDPITQVNFVGKNKYEVEENSIRDILAMAAEYGMTIVIVTHTKNRAGAAASLEPTGEDIQGSSWWYKLCHTAIMLNSHEDKDSRVYTTPENGYEKEVTHNRTMIIAKARNGSGAGQRFAFKQLSDSPEFNELGVIKPKSKK